MSLTATVFHTINTQAKTKFFNIALLLVFLGLASLMFYNLEVNPRSWHDEGGAISVAKTLVNDGVYAVRNSDGYQTFGPIQSTGPTVILPVALAFKVFGIHILSARIVAVIYSIVALLLFFFLGKRIFGTFAAFFACLFLISFTSTSFFYYGRQVHGAYPALAFFFGALLVYGTGLRTGNRITFFLSGILLGGAMITKSQYVLMGCGTLVVMGVLDYFFNRRKNLLNLLIIGGCALACFALWMIWQYAYYGPVVFFENSAKLRDLAISTSGFDPKSTLGAIRYLFGRDSGHFFLFWGFPAIIYAGIKLWSSKEVSSAQSFLFIFCVLWLFYFIFWTLPWSENCIAPCVITAIFVGKLFHDVIRHLTSVLREFIQNRRTDLDLNVHFGVVITVMACLPILGFSLYSLEKLASADILDRVGMEQIFYRGPRSFQELDQVTGYLSEKIDSGVVVETWERELSLFTNNNFHYPDQSILAASHNAKYRNGIRNYELGADYFNRVRPEFLVIGWFERYNPIYDMKYISEHAKLIKSFGDDAWRYDLYQFLQ